MSTPIDDRGMLVADGSRVVMRRPNGTPILNAQGQLRWSSHPEGVPMNRWSSQRYEAAVLATCRRILSNDVGKVVVRFLRLPVKIIPFGRQNTDNAFAELGFLRGRTPRGEQPRYCGDLASTPFDDTGRPIPNMPRGTGRGSATWVEFTPRGWSGVTAAALDPRPGRWADEVLLHELVHALATTWGAGSCRAAGFNYDTYDEYVAITVTNVYCSHYNRPSRDSHDGTAIRPDDVPQNRLDAEDNMMRDLNALMGDFCMELARIPSSYASHNPFRDRGIVPRSGPTPRMTITSGAPRISARQRVGR